MEASARAKVTPGLSRPTIHTSRAPRSVYHSFSDPSEQLVVHHHRNPCIGAPQHADVMEIGGRNPHHGVILAVQANILAENLGIGAELVFHSAVLNTTTGRTPGVWSSSGRK